MWEDITLPSVHIHLGTFILSFSEREKEDCPNNISNNTTFKAWEQCDELIQWTIKYRESPKRYLQSGWS